MDSIVETLVRLIPAALPTLRGLLLVVTFVPVAAACRCIRSGGRARNPRRFALWFGLLHLLLTGALVGLVGVQLTQRGDPDGTGVNLYRPEPGFRPIAVPGDPGFENDE